MSIGLANFFDEVNLEADLFPISDDFYRAPGEHTTWDTNYYLPDSN